MSKQSSDPRIALVTGASRGIGKAIALHLAAQGYVVCGTATTAAGAEGISDALQSAGYAGHGVVLNQADVASIDAMYAELKANKHMPTILVNNAGITRDNILLRMRADEWMDVMQTNLHPLYNMCKPVLKTMVRARWGRIINISSVVASMGNVGQCNYAAAKAGMEAFTKSVAREMAGFNITANCVAPGMIETEMTAAVSEEKSAVLNQMIPMKRMGKPEDVAAAVSFLASESANYVTGETLHVNGGMLMG